MNAPTPTKKKAKAKAMPVPGQNGGSFIESTLCFMDEEKPPASKD